MSCCDLTVADYRDRGRPCDIVMKGGITSGVVYPHAVCELARTYHFRNVGGTSAGAIAAAAAAAAEYGRLSGGFNDLASLPDWLGEGSHLRDLFQPQPGTKKLFRLTIASLEGGPVKLVTRALTSYPLATLLGALPGLVLAGIGLAAAIDSGSTGLIVAAAIAAAMLGLPMLVLGVVLAVSAWVTREAAKSIPRNRFGLCSGMKGEGPDQEALTEWLSERLDGYAGIEGRLVDGKRAPLTFGDLWRGPSKKLKDPLPEPDDRWLQLAMMTTNLVNRRAHQLPWESREWFFDPTQFQRLFPKHVVEWMVDHPPSEPEDYTEPEKQESQMRRALMWPKLPLPAPEDLPVIVATRMSLSFPVLLSAVPLWNLDMTRPENKSLEQWKRWCVNQGKDFKPLDTPREKWPADGQPKTKPVPECAWFSDGGISSNFPIHFFDRLIPRWPTFTINLRPFPFEQEPQESELDNTSMVKSNSDGIAEWWYRLPAAGGILDRRLFGFLSSVVRTMQNRVDEALMRAPGYRDRVAHVNLSADEGGMNLTMPASRIEALTARGRFAAIRLRDAYTPPNPPEKKITWDNHRWVRFRSSLAVLEEMTSRFASGYGAPPVDGDEPTYADLVAAPPSYRFKADWQEQVADIEVSALKVVAKTVEDAPGSMAVGQPRPAPQGRITPRD